MQKQSSMHNNMAINKHRCAVVPETGLMRETLVRLLLPALLLLDMLFLVKLFPEITVKSRPVRKRLVRLCRKNLKIVVSRTDEGFANVGVLDARAEFSRQMEHSLEPD
ncbi:MAG: hypothetical protein VXX24_05305 [Pseudomonadota bacterium]|nr:hypothetical protein [Pseudomonadota bacterium]